MRRAEILKAALDLSEDEREKLVEELSATLRAVGGGAGLSPGWEAEIARRIRRIESGEATFVSAEKTFEEADEFVRAARASR